MFSGVDDVVPWLVLVSVFCANVIIVSKVTEARNDSSGARPGLKQECGEEEATNGKMHTRDKDRLTGRVWLVADRGRAASDSF